MLDLLGVARESRRRSSSTSSCTTAAARAAATAAAAAGRRRCRSTPRRSSPQLPAELRARVAPLCEQPKIRLLRDESKMRLARLIARAAQAVDDGRCTLAAAVQFVDWLEPLLRRESYLALLAERPEVQNRLLRLLGLARWPMRYLMLHPGVIDELADERLLHDRFDAEAYTRELEERHQGWERSSQAEEELLLDTLRRAHHAEVFRTLVRDVEGHITVEQVADDLSALADATLSCALRWAWKHLKTAHRPEPQLAVIAYGKLGGKELGYGSDLDVVFVYDDPETDARQGGRGLRRVRAQAHHLADDAHRRRRAVRHRHGASAERQLGPAGHVDDLVRELPDRPRQQHRVDLGAPGADAGALVRRHRAAGAALRGGAAQPSSPRRATCTRCSTEVRAMREKVRAAHPVKAGRFDFKHSAGGMMDVEFAVQALVLGHGAHRAELLDDVGNIALLRRAEAAGLLARRRRRRCGRRVSRPAPRAAPGAPRRAADAGRARGARRAEQRRRRALACGLRLTAAAPGARSPPSLARRRRWLGVRAACRAGARLAAGARRCASRGARSRAAFVHYSALHLLANLAGDRAGRRARRRSRACRGRSPSPGCSPGR